MIHVDQETVVGRLPDSFYALKRRIFVDAGLCNEEFAESVEALLALQRENVAVELFMVEGRARLLGIHPSGSDVALFGFWETENNPSLHAALFSAFEKWAFERGCMRVEGPKNFNTFHDYRLRTSTAPWGQFNREPANPTYYPALLEQLGYSAVQMFSSRLLSTEVIPKAYVSKQDLIEGLKSLSYDFIPLTRANWKKYASEIFALVCVIFGQNPGFQSVSTAEFELLYNADYAEMLCPHTSVLMVDRSTGRLVAISLCYPNYLPLALEERPVFVKHYPLLQHRTLLAKTQGVHPDYRQQGLMNFLGAYGMLSFRKYYDDIIFCLMREGNPSLRFTEPFEYSEASYGLYGKTLPVKLRSTKKAANLS